MTAQPDTFQRVTRTLDENDMPFVVVGSVGASAWGLNRMTQDVDVVTVAARERASALIETFKTHDLYVPENDAASALASGGTFNILNFETQEKIDVFVTRPDDQFESMRLSRRVRKQVLGTESWVARPEDIILAKLRWRLTSRSEQQWRDCIELLASNTIDREHLRSWADHLGVRQDLDELLALVPPAD